MFSRLKSFLLPVALGLFTFSAAAEVTWVTSLPDALRQAAAEDKAVLVDFTGSDWCGWCIRLKKEVFDQPEFAAFAQENLIMVELDFPRRKALPPALKEENERLAEKYGVEGFPTIFILDRSGKTLQKTGYMAGGAPNYIKELSKIKGYTWKAAKPGTGGVVSASGTAPGKTAAPAKVNAPDIMAKPVTVHRFEGLVLKGISGSPKRRLALINSTSVEVGETVTVMSGDKKIKITCQEIGEKSVRILVEGEKEPRELHLSAKL